MGRLVSIVSHSRPSLMIIASVSQFHVHGVNICLAQCLKCETTSRRGLLRDYELSRGHSFEALVRAGGCSPHVLTNLSTQLVIRKLVHTCKSDVSSLPNSTVGLRRPTSAKNICLKRKKKYLHLNSEYLCLKFFILLSVHILNISTDIYQVNMGQRLIAIGQWLHLYFRSVRQCVQQTLGCDVSGKVDAFVVTQFPAVVLLCCAPQILKILLSLSM